MEKSRRLPDSELEIMLIIWDANGQISTSDILQRIRVQRDEEKTSVQLVQNYLNRLEEKGFVRCEKIGRLNHYYPLVTLEDYRAWETASFLERLYKNSPTKLFTTLLENNSLDAQDIEMIQQLLEKGGE